MPDRSRRRALAALGAALAGGIGGCLGDGSGTRTGTGTGTAVDGGARPTATARDPRSLDASGDWPQAGSDASRDGAAAAGGAGGDAAVYWHLRRVRSGPAVRLGDRLFHYGKVGEETGGRPTVTRTREPDAGTAHPVYGRPALFARDASDASLSWTAPLDAAGVGWPAAADDRVVSAVSGSVAAHDAATGEVLWTRDAGERPPGVPAVADDTAIVPLQGAVSGDEYVRKPSVRAYALADGSERWAVEPPARSVAVAIAGDTVIVRSHGYDGEAVVEGRALADGTRRWEATVTGNFFDRPVVAGGAVYLTGGGDAVTALDAADGSERWSRNVGAEPGQVAADGEAVYLAAEGRALALDAADGATRWSVGATDGESEAVGITVAVGSDAVYAGFQGTGVGLGAFDIGDGSELWSHRFPNTVVEGDMVLSGVESQPAVVDGAVYVYAVDGLYAFGPA